MVVISELKTFHRIYADTRNENTGKIVAKQHDTKTRYLDITVTDNGVPVDLTDCEVRIYGRKKDGTEFYNDGTLQDAETGRCLFEATTQMLAYAGQNVNCEIVVFKDNEQILSTMPFDIFVVESLMGASAIESSNEYGALVILYQNLYEAIDLMTTMVQNIGVPAEVAAQYDLATMWQAWEFLVAYMKGDFTDKVDEAIANSSTQGVLDILNTTTAKEDTAQEILATTNKISGATCTKKSVVSDTVVATLISSAVSVEEDTKIASFVVNTFSGEIKVTLSIKQDSTSSHDMKIYKNGSKYATISNQTTSYTTYKETISVVAGDKISFELCPYLEGHVISCNLITLGYELEEVDYSKDIVIL